MGEPISRSAQEIPHGNIELMGMPVFTAPVLPSPRSPLSLRTPPGVALGEALALQRNGEVTDQRDWSSRLMD